MIIKPPQNFDQILLPSIFLAGSIEMGSAIDWQVKVAESLDNPNWMILNPRRDNWDNSWEQSVKNPNFVQQVNWELDGIERSNLTIFYFSPETRAPITLMELGIAALQKQFEDTIVCCPAGFWRKGNVDVVCKRFNIRQVPTLDDLIEEAKDYIDSK